MLSLNYKFLYWSPETSLKVPCRSRTLGPLGDLQGTYLGRRVQASNALDIIVLILLNLLLASIIILLCFFFLFCVAFNSFFMIPVVIENAKLKLTLDFPTDTPIAAAKEAIDTPPIVSDKTIEVLSK